MVNYQLGKIYKLWSDESDMMYIGSTTQPLHKRLAGHKSDTGRGRSKTYIAMQNHPNIRIELIENFPCNSKDELTAREGHYIRLNKDQLLNKAVPGRTREEYEQDNREHITERSRLYQQTNFEVLAQKRREYREENREVIAKKKKDVYEENREAIAEYKKQYREENQGAISEYNKEYYEANKERIAERSKQFREANREVLAEKRKQRRLAKNKTD